MEHRKKAIGYGRVSTEGQLKGTSKDEQERKIKEMVERGSHEFLEFVSDDGRSGKTIKGRAGLQKIIQKARANEFDVLYFTKLDRLARNLRELLNIWSEFEEIGLEMVCIDEPAVNTKGRFGKAMLQLLGMFAEFERELIRERTEDGRKIKWEKGETPIGGTPFGYKWDDDKKEYVRCPETAPIYERMVSMYVDQNMTYKDIAIQLTREGIASPSARIWKKRKGPNKWNATMVSKTLKSPAYKGEVIHNKYVHVQDERKGYHYPSKDEKPVEEWITVKYPALITEDRWNQIQTMIQHRKGKPKKDTKGMRNIT